VYLMLQLPVLQIWEEHETSWFWFLFYSGKFWNFKKREGEGER